MSPETVKDWRPQPIWPGGEIAGVRVSAFYSVQAFNWLDEAPPTLGKAMCFIQSTDLDSTLIKNTLMDTPRDSVWPIILASHGWVRLTHKISHHKTTGNDAHSRILRLPLFCQVNSVCMVMSGLLGDVSTRVKQWEEYMWDVDQFALCITPVFLFDLNSPGSVRCLPFSEETLRIHWPNTRTWLELRVYF